MLAILTTALTIVVPYIARSNDGLKVGELCQDIACAVEYAVDCALNTSAPVRLVVSPQSRFFQLERAEDISGGIYTSLDEISGQPRFFDERLHIIDIDGFDVLSTDRYILVFDPRKPWPHAEIAVTSDKVAQRIYIRGPRATVQHMDL